MSDKEWYEGLTGKELSGKHVHAVFKTGTVADGRLEWDGLMYVSHTRQIAVLGPGDGGSWELSPGVESVSLVWDERDWEEIRTEDISKADAVVVNGRLIRVNGLYSTNQFRPVDVGVSVPFEHVSCALRRRSKLPTEPGFYGSCMDGETIYLSHDGDWWLFDADGMVHLETPPADFLPLTPVHFVDGRAE